MKALALTATAAPMDGPDERFNLIEAARAGDRAAFEQIVRQHERLVLVTALRLLGNIEDAKDVSQEVFLRLFRNLGKLDRDDCRSWLYKVTVNLCRDAWRRRPAESPAEELEAMADRSPGPLEVAGEAERRRALDMSLRLLSERERAAVVLRDLEGLTTEEVARTMGTSEATVRSRICAARVKMHGFLEGYFRRRS